ncbi:MAG TPA: DUF1549 and DUF1553 domain-containing protein [Tepidisphaeraceae bacterium]|jgi:hypothetical protein
MKRLRIAFSALAITFALVWSAFTRAPQAQARERLGSFEPSDSSRLHFPTQILPILTKAGCNAGACHGAAIGQGGFKLSLLGYDPESDFDAITRQFGGRRVDFSFPSQSLLLRKATHAIKHKGGERIDSDSADYRAVVRWIEESAPYGRRDLKVSTIEIRPTDVLVSAPGKTIQLKVTATLSDGSVEDVTAHALYSSNDDSVAVAGEEGSVEVTRRGLTAIMVRYGGQVAAVRVGAPMGDVEVEAGSFPPQNFIDEKVWDELHRMRVPPSALCSDDEFLRRVYLDLIGRLPSANEVRSFVAQPSTTAGRRKVISELLKRPEYADLWTLRFSDLLLIDSKRLGEEPARAYHNWVREQLASNIPFDRLVRNLLTASGDFSRIPTANFYRLAQDPRDMGEFVSSTFLGVQIACARCHAHPFASWTQEDFYGFAACFADLRSELTHPKTGRDIAPKPLGGRDPADRSADRHVALAEWLTSHENPYFAKAIVNRVWRYLMGRGIAEPVDDLRVSNPPSNPALLDALASDFVANGYDLSRLVQTIAESRTYQLSSHPTDVNRDDDRLFSHGYVKPLPPQVLADAIAQATQVPDAYVGYPAGTRAVELIDARAPSYALDVLGRCTRDIACDSRSRGGGVSQALHLMNGATVNEKFRGGVIDRLLANNVSDTRIADELYLSTLSRLPSTQERDFCIGRLATATIAADKRHLIEDLLWALLNSREFAYNH